MKNISPKRKVGGFKAKKQGQFFENAFMSHASHSCVVIKIPDGAKRIGPKTLIQVQTPFDVVLIHLQSKRVLFLDLKTTLNTSWPVSLNTPHQIAKLLEIEETGHIAGYVVYFRTPNELRFYSAKELTKERDRASLTREEGVFLGSLLNFELGHILVEPLSRK